MKKCPFCGSELPVDARFCGRCGRMQNSMFTIDESVQEQQPQIGRWPSEEDQDKWRGM
jgi:predicted amidophosphoribosyltransferase